MIFKDERDEKTKADHAWQDHRHRCLELAINSRVAGSENLIALAGQISDFIMTPTESETSAEPKDEDAGHGE